MVQSIGPTNSINANSTSLNRDAVKKAVEGAYRAYSYSNPEEYSNHMATFYEEGRKNPTLAKVIFYDTVRDSVINEYKENIPELSKSVKELKSAPTRGLVEPMIKENAIRMTESMVGPIKIAYAIKAYDAVATEMGDRLTDDVKPLKEAFENEFNSLYPISGEARQNAIREYKVSDTARNVMNQEDYEFFNKQIKAGEEFKPVQNVIAGIFDYFNPNKTKPKKVGLFRRLLRK